VSLHRDDGHQIRFVIHDGSLHLELQHPHTGLCPPSEDEEGNVVSEECFLTGWFDNLEPDEILHGEVAFWAPLTWEWIGAEPLIYVGMSR
jgi:hypothetical protein